MERLELPFLIARYRELSKGTIHRELAIMRVLIVEDNLDIQANIADFMENSFTLDFAYSGPQGLELALAHDYDVIVLDLMLPGMDGIEVCRSYRAKALVQAPILMLTARDTMDDKETGFEAGADDYLVKPFSLRELKMRIEALSRRPKLRTAPKNEFAGLELDRASVCVRCGESSSSLHEKEATLLACLMEEAPEVVSGETLTYQLWNDEPPESGALRTHVYNLRKALERLGWHGKLNTVRGRGYQLLGEEA